jgi:hypothetical protein
MQSKRGHSYSSGPAIVPIKHHHVQGTGAYTQTCQSSIPAKDESNHCKETGDNRDEVAGYSSANWHHKLQTQGTFLLDKENHAKLAPIRTRDIEHHDRNIDPINSADGAFTPMSSLHESWSLQVQKLLKEDMKGYHQIFEEALHSGSPIAKLLDTRPEQSSWTQC